MATPVPYKRARDAVDDEDPWLSSEDRSRKRVRRQHPTPDLGHGPSRWACPFQKLNPAEEVCGIPTKRSNHDGGFENLNRLKTHLKDSHDSSRRCKKCWKLIRVGAGDHLHRALHQHEAENSCAARPCPRKYWFGEEERRRLNLAHHRVDLEHWYRLMKAVIPEFRDSAVEEIKARYTPYYEPLAGESGYSTPPPAFLPTPGTTCPETPPRIATARLLHLTSRPDLDALDRASQQPPHILDAMPFYMGPLGIGATWDSVPDPTAAALPMPDSLGQANLDRQPLVPIDQNKRLLDAIDIIRTPPATGSSKASNLSADSPLLPETRKLRESVLQLRDAVTSTTRCILEVGDLLQEVQGLEAVQSDPNLSEKLGTVARLLSKTCSKLCDV